ncbi:MAG: WD40/YVTN/BNR-like repeat-containing protein [Gemmatimonadota bacterium]
MRRRAGLGFTRAFRSRIPLGLTLGLALAVSAFDLPQQTPAPGPSSDAASVAAAGKARAAGSARVRAGPAVDPSYLKLLKWRSLGPTRGGRVLAVEGDPARERVFYQGTAGGGVWKTEDGGLSWHNISDGYFGAGSVGAIAVSRSDPDVVYVGMGESCVRGNATDGDGLYRSLDAGKTWTHVGLERTLHIARVRIDPRDPNTVYVAALGDVWGPSPERGVYRSRDGGRTWKNVLYRDENTGAIDLVLDPSRPDVLYASLLELRRFPWGFRSAGPGTGLFKSTDGGDTWTELTDRPGLPSGLKGRIGIAVSPARPDRVWAIVDAELGKKGVFRSDDGGATWTRVNHDADLTQRPWYYHHIFAGPADANTVYVLNVRMWKSTDGGETFKPVAVPHGDNHDLWIDPRDPARMVEGNDGGATVSFDGGRSWSTLLNQPTAQIYHVAVDDQVPYRVYGAQQDNTTLSLPSRSDAGRITIEDWYTVGGGEAGYIAPRPDDPQIVYAADHHWLYRWDGRTRQVRDISPNPETHYGWGSADINDRFWWTYPVVLSPHDPGVLYVTSQYVHRSTDAGRSWEIISPDLTRHDPSTLERTPDYLHPETGKYWGPITREAYGPEWYATIFAFAESPLQAGVLWAGSDDGLIHLSRDGGAHWRDVSIPDLPEFALISIIEPSPHDAATAYVAATRYKLSDRRPYLYRTTDFGRTWTKITDGIAESDFTRVIREDPGRAGLLFAGTETGVYVSFDAGARWQPLRLNLPVVPVHDLAVKDGDLVAATHGRGFWVLDDAALLRQLDPAALADPVHLFRPRPTIRYGRGAFHAAAFSGGAGPAGGDGTGANPPDGVVIPYYFREKPEGEVTLRIFRGDTLVRSFSSATEEAAPRTGFFERARGDRRVRAGAGANRFVWDTRYPGADVIEDAVFQGRADGPRAPPGVYRVELAAGGRTLSREFRILRDPRIEATDADLQEQFRFLIATRDELTRTMDVVRKIRRLRKDAEARVERAGGGPELEAALKRLNDRLYPLEERLVQYRARAGQDLIAQPTGIDSKLARLLAFASMGDARPTRGERDLLRRLSAGVAERAAALEAVKRGEYAELVRLTGLEGRTP